MASEQQDRLVGSAEARRILGVKSMAALNAIVARAGLPPFIKRGTRKYQLHSDLQRYLERLAASRAAA